MRRPGVGGRLGRLVAAAVLAAAALLGCRGRQASSPAATASVRAPAAAGSFYPADPGELRATVDALLAGARAKGVSVAIGRPLVGIVVPHAGFIYSGPTAALAYAALEGRRYDAVVLLGSPHRVPLHGASVYTGEGFSTPLGVVRVERDLARELASAGSLFGQDPAPHAPEHSLEVQLPFLQAVLPGSRIVPILLMADEPELAAMAAKIADVLARYRSRGHSVLVVVSTDLAHYPPKADAERIDRNMLEALRVPEGERLVASSRLALEASVPGLVCAMCGLDAAYVGAEVVRRLGAVEGVILGSATSADAPGAQPGAQPGAEAGAEEGAVVGYGALAFVAEAGSLAASPEAAAPERYEPLSQGEESWLLGLARRTLLVAVGLDGESGVEVPEAYRRRLEERRGVFVTLTRDGELRGCIGIHEPEAPLWQTVRSMARASAFEDPRFPPVSASELGSLRIAISVYLTPVLPVSSPAEIEIGRHGVVLRVGGRAATFLPEVAVSQGWDREETLRQLCMKAGLPRDAWKSAEARLSVYETQEFAE